MTKNEAARRMLAAKVPCAPVRDLNEVMNDENMLARGSLQRIDHPELGRVVLPHSPLVFEGAERRPIEPSSRSARAQCGIRRVARSFGRGNGGLPSRRRHRLLGRRARDQGGSDLKAHGPFRSEAAAARSWIH
jgi:hypothetical protein